MFKKVLIAEDFGWTTKSIEQQLITMGVKEIVATEYCDDAHIKFLKALKDKKCFDLLIADLSFKKDHRVQKLKSGDKLIAAVRKHSTDIKVIVFSMEDRLQRIRSLFKEQHIDAYVFKSRKSMEEMKEALISITKEERYISPQVAPAVNKQQNLDIDDYDILLLKKLAEGYSNKEISDQFRKDAIIPSGISSIEKRLYRLRIQFKANNAVQLIAIAKDLGMI